MKIDISFVVGIVALMFIFGVISGILVGRHEMKTEAVIYGVAHYEMVVTNGIASTKWKWNK